MRKTPEILRVEFKPPSEERLEVEVMSIDELRQRAPADHFASLQRADFYRLFGVKGGHTRPMVDFSPYLLQARDWLLVRPGQVMRYDFSRPWTGWLAVFRPDSFFGGPRGTRTGELDLLRRVEDLACLSSVDTAQDGWMDYGLRQMRHDGSLAVDVGAEGGIDDARERARAPGGAAKGQMGSLRKIARGMWRSTIIT